MILRDLCGQACFFFSCMMHFTEIYAHFYSRSVDVQTLLLNCRIPVKNSVSVRRRAMGNSNGGRTCERKKPSKQIRKKRAGTGISAWSLIYTVASLNCMSLLLVLRLNYLNIFEKNYPLFSPPPSAQQPVIWVNALDSLAFHHLPEPTTISKSRHQVC